MYDILDGVRIGLFGNKLSELSAFLSDWADLSIIDSFSLISVNWKS